MCARNCTTFLKGLLIITFIVSLIYLVSLCMKGPELDIFEEMRHDYDDSESLEDGADTDAEEDKVRKKRNIEAEPEEEEVNEENKAKDDEWVEVKDDSMMDAKVMKRGKQRMVIIDMPNPKAMWMKKNNDDGHDKESGKIIISDPNPPGKQK